MSVLSAIFLSAYLLASTHPLTGSSIINQPSNSMAFTQMGFTLDSIPSNWVYRKSLSTSNMLELGTDNKTLLTFILENVSVKTQLETYVRQYLRDYNQYGFEVTSIQSHSKSLVPSVIVDLNRKNKSSKSRQVFFYKDTKMIIATCADENADFNKTIITCNQILGSFKWR
ncbi:hypothetical protein K2P97_08365 [bacterium]|nr:hypothetical protein [bacterium]